MKVTLTPINDIRASTYNPRRADPLRLELVELSLRKLGFLSPIFADDAGEIISGHQRHYVATKMGMTHVPVHRLPRMSLNQRKAINIVFNRATNDMEQDATSATISEEMKRMDVQSLARKLADFDGPHRCLKPLDVDVSKLVKANHGRWIDYASTVGKTLRNKKITIPIVCLKNDRVINGIGRLQAAAEHGDETIPVVRIEDEEAEFARAMLNLLSMDFDLHTRYAESLRFGSFRRPLTTRPGLGRGFYAEHFGAIRTTDIDLGDPSTLARWRRRYGRVVVDFGAGRFDDTEILRAHGIDVTPFEPYPCVTGSEPNKQLAVSVAKEFLKAVAEGKAFDAVFLSSVLNSIPFKEDREHVATIASALCGDHGTTYAWTMGVEHASWMVTSQQNRNERNATYGKFRLDYEDGITLGDFGNAPKVQKYHQPDELYELFKKSFKAVRVRKITNHYSVTARGPAYTQDQLREAIEFEFDLPYSDGTRMGLAQDAVTAFAQRGCL